MTTRQYSTDVFFVADSADGIAAVHRYQPVVE
jgi:hypothetical protein